MINPGLGKLKKKRKEKDKNRGGRREVEGIDVLVANTMFSAAPWLPEKTNIPLKLEKRELGQPVVQFPSLRLSLYLSLREK
jgi:hypothetical protein